MQSCSQLSKTYVFWTLTQAPVFLGFAPNRQRNSPEAWFGTFSDKIAVVNLDSCRPLANVNEKVRYCICGVQCCRAWLVPRVSLTGRVRQPTRSASTTSVAVLRDSNRTTTSTVVSRYDVNVPSWPYTASFLLIL